ncbi:MAG: PIN domain-containing protein [Acidobacteriota bacterium]
MKNFVFVDTGAWFAAVTPTDPNHTVTTAWMNANDALLLTTDYVVDETLTLLRARGENKRALAIGEQFFNSDLATIYRLTDEDLFAAWEIFRDYDDKGWSFTDCASKVVMEKFRVDVAIAFDHHFRQFGTVLVVP